MIKQSNLIANTSSIVLESTHQHNLATLAFAFEAQDYSHSVNDLQMEVCLSRSHSKSFHNYKYPQLW